VRSDGEHLKFLIVFEEKNKNLGKTVIFSTKSILVFVVTLSQITVDI